MHRVLSAAVGGLRKLQEQAALQRDTILGPTPLALLTDTKSEIEPSRFMRARF